VPTTNLSLDFPDEKAQEDFEVAFRGWLKQYQQQAGLARALTGGPRPQGGGQAGSTGGLMQGAAGGSGAHSYGGGAQGQGAQGQQAGLLSIGSGQAGPYGVKDFYLNFIGGW